MKNFFACICVMEKVVLLYLKNLEMALDPSESVILRAIWFEAYSRYVTYDIRVRHSMVWVWCGIASPFSLL